ncbi:putative protein OS=Rhodanobacter lindaniclasticus OX=75310 GN=B1991_06805 PE=4 SV=1 [Rhodanobacter lindaniclasticus]
MDRRITSWHHPGEAGWPEPLRRRPGIALLVVLAALLAWSCLGASGETTELPAANQLAHWRDAGHDWLLVVDPQTRELVVYDASDGRPLRRLGAGDGVPPVQSVVLQGSWLFVMGVRHPRVRLLKLPRLQPVAVDKP